MRLERLASEVDLEGFRGAARALLAQGIEPDAVQWAVADRAAPALWDADAPASTTPAPGPPVPADFVDLCRAVVLHRDPQRFHLMYRLLWRLQHEPALRIDALDGDRALARRMAQSVRRDMHKMKAFVRFRDTGELRVAWFEPEHHIVEAIAPFFARRFTAMAWAILTPRRSVRWTDGELQFGPGAEKHQVPPADAGEALWLTYYQSIFNPARLKLRAMAKEMPRKYWRNLPESGLISALSAQAVERSAVMLARPAQAAARRLPAPPPSHAASVPRALPPGADRQAVWQAQRDAARHCRDCPLGAHATQTVWGEGPIGAALMLVGEQPGDQEDLQGRPFVGPSGQLLGRAIDALGWDRSLTYVTNGVKHFKYEPRGKRRIHKTPSQQEADACAHWLDAEIALVRPRAIVALGATAARQVLKRPVGVLSERGVWLPGPDGVPVLVTLHPSALLRADPAERQAQFGRWVEDLSLATPYAQAA